jgi:hypothetical protein
MPSVEAILATTENQVAILMKQRRVVAKGKKGEIYQCELWGSKLKTM